MNISPIDLPKKIFSNLNDFLDRKSIASCKLVCTAWNNVFSQTHQDLCLKFKAFIFEQKEVHRKNEFINSLVFKGKIYKFQGRINRLEDFRYWQKVFYVFEIKDRKSEFFETFDLHNKTFATTTSQIDIWDDKDVEIYKLSKDLHNIQAAFVLGENIILMTRTSKLFIEPKELWKWDGQIDSTPISLGKFYFHNYLICHDQLFTIHDDFGLCISELQNCDLDKLSFKTLFEFNELKPQISAIRKINNDLFVLKKDGFIDVYFNSLRFERRLNDFKVSFIES